MFHSNYDGTPGSVPDLRDIAPARSSDKGELNSLPFLFKVSIVACAIMAGKTQAEARTAVRQAFNLLSN
jgi:hypothetical protein